MKPADSDKTGRRPCRSPCSRELRRLLVRCHDNCPGELSDLSVLTANIVSAVDGFEIRFMKAGPNAGSDTKKRLEIVWFQTDGLFEGQIRLFDAIEVTLYGGFGESEFSGYGLPRDSVSRPTQNLLRVECMHKSLTPIWLIGKIPFANKGLIHPIS